MQSICGFAWGLALVLRRGTVKSDEAGASRCVMGRTVAGLNRHTPWNVSWADQVW
jgi:hypothetical protein